MRLPVEEDIDPDAAAYIRAKKHVYYIYIGLL